MWRWRGPQDTQNSSIKVCFFFLFFPFFFWLHHTAWGNLSSSTSDQTHALCIGSMESWLLHHRGSPKVCLFFFFFFIFLLLTPNLGHADDCHHSLPRQWRRPLLRMLDRWKIWSGILSASYGLSTHVYEHQKKKNRTDFDYHFSCTIGFHD